MPSTSLRNSHQYAQANPAGPSRDQVCLSPQNLCLLSNFSMQRHRWYRGACTRFIAGECTMGRHCPREHIVIAGDECRDFKLGHCLRGVSCVLLHIPLQEECRNFNLGFCRRGSRCNRIHVLKKSVDYDSVC